MANFGGIVCFLVLSTPVGAMELLLALRNHSQQCSENPMGCRRSNLGWQRANVLHAVQITLVPDVVTLGLLGWTEAVGWGKILRVS